MNAVRHPQPCGCPSISSVVVNLDYTKSAVCCFECQSQLLSSPLLFCPVLSALSLFLSSYSPLGQPQLQLLIHSKLIHRNQRTKVTLHAFLLIVPSHLSPCRGASLPPLLITQRCVIKNVQGAKSSMCNWSVKRPLFASLLDMAHSLTLACAAPQHMASCGVEALNQPCSSCLRSQSCRDLA